MTVFFALAFGYLLGSIPFGWVLSRAAGLGDIRAIGSHSIGATNVLRTGRRDIAALTLLMDGGKGAVAVLAVRYTLWPEIAWLAGLAAVVGHCTSIWMGGRGGKGVATGLGMVFGVAWPVGVGCCLVWLGIARLVRISSAAGLGTFVAAPVLMALWLGWMPAAIVALVSLVVIVRHKDNIARLRAGTEPRIGAK